MPFQEEIAVLVGSGVAIAVDVAGCGVCVYVEDATSVSVGLGVEVAVGLDVTVTFGKGVKNGRLVAVGVGAGTIALQAVKATTEQRVITIFNDGCIKHSFYFRETLFAVSVGLGDAGGDAVTVGVDAPMPPQGVSAGVEANTANRSIGRRVL